MPHLLWSSPRSIGVDDLINVLIILGFFALTWGFVRLCDRLWGGPPC